MLEKEEYERRTYLLLEFLKNLAATGFKTPEDAIKELQQVYTFDDRGKNEYRHEYSQLMQLISEINESSDMSEDALVLKKSGANVLMKADFNDYTGYYKAPPQGADGAGKRRMLRAERRSNKIVKTKAYINA